MHALAIDQFGRASLELGSLANAEPSLLRALRLDAALFAVLWNDVAWLDYAIRTEQQSAPATNDDVCDSCGTSVQKNARFCTECGSRVG
jgi:hypothetical protein